MEPAAVLLIQLLLGLSLTLHGVDATATFRRRALEGDFDLGHLPAPQDVNVRWMDWKDPRPQEKRQLSVSMDFPRELSPGEKVEVFYNGDGIWLGVAREDGTLAQGCPGGDFTSSRSATVWIEDRLHNLGPNDIFAAIFSGMEKDAPIDAWGEDSVTLTGDDFRKLGSAPKDMSTPDSTPAGAPRVVLIAPSQGHTSGGTKVSIFGHHLQWGQGGTGVGEDPSAATVIAFVGDKPCAQTNSRSPQRAVCVTPPGSGTDLVVTVQLRIERHGWPVRNDPCKVVRGVEPHPDDVEYSAFSYTDIEDPKPKAFQIHSIIGMLPATGFQIHGVIGGGHGQAAPAAALADGSAPPPQGADFVVSGAAPAGGAAVAVPD